MTSNHPNATAGGLAGALATIIVFAVSLTGVDVPGEVGAAVATITATVVLALGRRRRRR